MDQKKFRIMDAGNGGIDLESEVEKGLQDMRVPALFAAHDDDGMWYYGKLAGHSSNGTIKLESDSKLNVEHFEMGGESSRDAFLGGEGALYKDILQLKVKKKNIGQGALNAAVQRAVFLDSMPGADDIERYLTSIYHHQFIEDELSKYGTNYDPACGIHREQPSCQVPGVPSPCSSAGNIFININATHKPEIKKATIRTSIDDFCGLSKPKVFDRVTEDDVMFIDSVKDPAFLTVLYQSILENRHHVYIQPTESMVKNVGAGMVNEVLRESEVYVAQIPELELLLYGPNSDTRIRSYDDLKSTLEAVQARMKFVDGKKARVYVTCDDRGAFVLDENGDMYHQKAIPDTDPLDFDTDVGTTSGCGDAFCGVVTSLEFLRTHNRVELSTAQMLGYANIAGQINAALPYTAGPEMANVTRINEYLAKNPDMEQVSKYNPNTKRFHSDPNNPIDPLPMK